VRLLTWYRRHGRDLPWRRTDDPYHILVSEIMLQQTQVDRVLPKYGEWLAKYPSMHVLAAAPEDEVTATWYPLGYNIRPRRLQTIAREAVTRYGGLLPADEATLRSFKGIGAYTAGAIRSFAFRQRAAILDTNVARVLFRVFVGTGDLKSHAMRRHLWTLSEALGAAPSRLRFQSGIDGPRRHGLRRAQSKVPDLPDDEKLPGVPGNAERRTKSEEPRTTNRERRTQNGERTRKNGERRPVLLRAMMILVVAAAIIERDDTYLVTRRQPGVHLEGHWEFPGGKCEAGETIADCLTRELREELAADAVVGAEVFTTSHDYPDRRSSCTSSVASCSALRPRSRDRRSDGFDARRCERCDSRRRTRN